MSVKCSALMFCREVLPVVLTGIPVLPSSDFFAYYEGEISLPDMLRGCLVHLTGKWYVDDFYDEISTDTMIPLCMEMRHPHLDADFSVLASIALALAHNHLMRGIVGTYTFHVHPNGAVHYEIVQLSEDVVRRLAEEDLGYIYDINLRGLIKKIISTPNIDVDYDGVYGIVANSIPNKLLRILISPLHRDDSYCLLRLITNECWSTAVAYWKDALMYRSTGSDANIYVLGLIVLNLLSGLPLHHRLYLPLNKGVCTQQIRASVTALDKSTRLVTVVTFDTVSDASAEELQWCRDNAPDSLKSLSDDELLESMHDLYVKYGK